MKKKINKFLFMVLLSVAMVVSAGIFSFSNNYKTAYASNNNGGGLYVGNNSVFNFTHGSISGMTATNGGGVYVANGGTFNMSGGSIFGNKATNNGDSIYNNGTFIMTGGTIGETEGVGWIYCNEGSTTKIYGGTVLDNFYMYSNLQTKVGATIDGKIELSDSNKITVEDYAGTTPTYKIKLNASRNAGTIVTFLGNKTTSPDISKFTVTGYNTDYDIVIRKNSNGYFELALTTIELPSTWQTEIASSTYMTTTVTPANLTSIKFVSSVPSGYTKIGTLSTGLPVYKGTTATEIAFVAKSIYAPVDSSYLFTNLKKLTTIDFAVFKTNNVTNMSSMFYNCSSLTSLNVSGFNTSNVTSTSWMFYSCKNLTSLDVSSFNTSNVTDMRFMFSSCSALTSLDVSGFNTSKVTNMMNMFHYCKTLTSLDVSSFDTSKVTNIDSMFYYCSALTSLDVSSFNTTKVKYIDSMFATCSSLTSLNVSGFSTSNVTDMSSMFYRCSGLTSLDLRNFNTSNVTDMSQMFYNCSSLTNLNVSSFSTSNVTDMSQMFYNCSSLTSLNVSSFNTSKVKNMNSMFQGCNNLTRLDISSFDMTKVTSSSDMLNFGTSAALKYIKTPYKNSTAIAITTGSTLYNVSTEEVATGVLKNTTSSQTLSIRFTLNLDANGGSCSVSSLVAYYYCSLTNIGKSLPTATKSGYTFSGWYTERTGGSRVYDSTPLTYTTATTLYAHWTEIVVPDPDPPTPPDPDPPTPDPDPPTPTDFDIEQAEYIIFTTTKPSGLSLNSNYSYASRTFFQTGTTPDVYTNDSGTQVAFVGGYGDLIAPTDCTGLFSNMVNLKWVIFRNYDTFNSTNFTSMFEGCGSLEFVDMLSIQTPQVESMRSMFKDCENLRQIALADFDCISLGDASYMFSGCSSLGNNPLYTGRSNIMTEEQLGSVPEIKYTYNLQYADYMFAGCGWGTFCMPFLFTDSLSSAGGMFENSTFTALDLSQFLCKNYDFSDICGETQLSVEAISTPRGCNPNNFINSNFNGTYYLANNGSDDTVDVFDQAGIENLVIPFSLCLVSSDVSGSYGGCMYRVYITEYRDSEIEYLIEKLCNYNVMLSGSKNDFNFQTYHISNHDLYYIIPHPTSDYDETGSEEGSFAGLIGNIGALKDDLVYGDFIGRWDLANMNNVEVITWHDDEIPAITLHSDGGDVFGGTTPYQNWYESPRHLFARVRYLPSVHFTDGRLLVGWTDALDMGVDVTYFTNIARLEASGGDWWESGLKVVTKSIDNYIENEYWSLPAASTFLQSKEESVNDLMQLYNENKQDILIPEDKKVTITELKIDKIA